tara:strand:- start:3386 stop:4129 length:744 start_codon:yes stop_codon:yes gene_type:complete
MSDSEHLAEGDVSAPELEATAPPVAEVQTPEDATPKTFTQDELDAVVSKRLAREQRKWEREQQRQAPPPVTLPPADQFESTEAYAEALAEQKALALVEQRERQRQQDAVVEAYFDREEQALGKYDDFKQVAYNPSLPITTEMAETIRASDIGPDVLYHLGTNPAEAARISKLSPLLQAKEIGKIEATLASAPPVKRTTSAPPPLSPVTPSSSGTPAYDTTDPRSISTMSTSEWIAQERQRQMRKAAN